MVTKNDLEWLLHWVIENNINDEQLNEIFDHFTEFEFTINEIIEILQREGYNIINKIDIQYDETLEKLEEQFIVFQLDDNTIMTIH